MSVPCNFHTHTCFCDGKDTPEEMVREAIRLGCSELGFSGHSYVPFDSEGGMSPQNTAAYIAEVKRLQSAYANQIQIHLGVEQDYFSPASTAGYEYVIGSVHYVFKDDQYLPVDLSEASFLEIVKTHYSGDFYGFCEDYYALVSKVYAKTRCQIIGHFDLITKYNEGNRYFDTSHPRYRAAVNAALDELMLCPVSFEINSGAIARGYRTTPYPENWILDRLMQNKVSVIRTSDCHDKRYLLLGL